MHSSSSRLGRRSFLLIGLGTLTALVACVLYCLPWHPGAGNFIVLDFLLHIGFFVGLALLLAPIRRPAWVFAALAVLAVLLEVLQWRIVGFDQLEWNDILANEAGVAVAAAVRGVLRRLVD